ncbi:hypothetical protein ACFL35_07680 [Candidatus Riflebacteria bacterium]
MDYFYLAKHNILSFFTLADPTLAYSFALMFLLVYVLYLRMKIDDLVTHMDEPDFWQNLENKKLSLTEEALRKFQEVELTKRLVDLQDLFLKNAQFVGIFFCFTFAILTLLGHINMTGQLVEARRQFNRFEAKTGKKITSEFKKLSIDQQKIELHKFKKDLESRMKKLEKAGD